MAVAHANEHEAAAAEVSGERICDGEGEVSGYGRVDGIAALLEDGDAGVGCVVLDGYDHGVGGAGGGEAGLLGLCGGKAGCGGDGCGDGAEG